MKKDKTTFFKSSATILVALLSLASCQDRPVLAVTSSKDYEHFLQVGGSATTSKYFKLWNSKITPDSVQLTSFGHVAGEYQRFFEATGQVKYLKYAEQALEKAVEIAAIGKAAYRRALARNYIVQHRFREALELAKTARRLGSGLKASQYLLFDLHMELGNYALAEKYLDSTRNFSDFDYLIRIAKWNDYKGRLDTAIAFMEKALGKARSSGNKQLMLWTSTNLADYYGHAGRIAESYRYYLESLELDPVNPHAKKGIAWIVYSHEKNAKEALRILDSVTEYYTAPDYFLLKAEIADFAGDNLKRHYNLDRYFKSVSNPAYGDMYNAYNVGFYLNEAVQLNRATDFAKREVQNRPTPHSYDLLAYSHFKNGNLDLAISLVENHIIGKTHEPGILLHAAEIYKASGRVDKASALKSELLGALYELGPSHENLIMGL